MTAVPDRPLFPPPAAASAAGAVAPSAARASDAVAPVVDAGAPPAAASAVDAGTTAAPPPELLAQLADDVLYAAEQDMWVRLDDDGLVTVGATHVVAAHGQFMLFTPRPLGTLVARDASLGVMETAKTAMAIHAPLSGRIVTANVAVVDDVTLVERAPYGEGWLFRMAPSALDAERAQLSEPHAYAGWLAPRLAQKLAVKPIDDEFSEDLIVDPNRGY
jgi:glycine cleavage system H protein